MSEVQVFTAPQGSVLRTVIKDGEPWFVASDVCQILDVGNTSLAVNGRADREGSGLDVDDRGIATVNTPFGEQQMVIVSEFGFYALAFKSRKPEAKKFKRWVTHDVIPSIRKTGSYTATPSFKVPQTLSEALRLAADLSDKVEAQALQIEHQRPAVEFVERFVEAKQTQNLRDVAKVIGIKQNDFVDLLISKGVLFRSRGKLTPKAEHMGAGRFEVKEIVTKDGFATVQMRFTTLGVEWIARKVAEWNQTTVVPA